METVAIVIGLIASVVTALALTTFTVVFIIDTIKGWKLKRGKY